MRSAASKGLLICALMALGCAAGATSREALVQSAVEALVGECRAGEQSSCDTLAVMQSYELCQQGNGLQCATAGFAFATGRGIDQNETTAAGLFLLGCDADYLPACSILASRFAAGKGVEQDFRQAIYFYAKACDGGFADGCAALGVIYTAGAGVERDAARARKYFERACSLGSAEHC